MTANPETAALAALAARAGALKKATQIVAIDVSERLALTDVFLILSGSNDRPVRAIVDAVEEALLRAGARRRFREGTQEAHWVLLDFGDIVVHVLQEQDREFYALERLWKDCPPVALPDDLAEVAAAAEAY